MIPLTTYLVLTTPCLAVMEEPSWLSQDPMLNVISVFGELCYKGQKEGANVRDVVPLGAFLAFWMYITFLGLERAIVSGIVLLCVPIATEKRIRRRIAIKSMKTSCILHCALRITHPLGIEPGRMLQGRKDLKIVGQAVNGREAVQLAAKLKPDVILMDVTMPEIDGFEATAQITRDNPDLHIIGLSMHNDPDTRQKMFDVGASAYLTKTDAPNTVVETILKLYHGTK
jgi:CheY-like chemotaxis protein